MAVIVLLHDLLGKDRVQPKYHEYLLTKWPLVAGSAAARQAADLGLRGLLPQTTAELEHVFEERHAESLARKARRALLRRPATLSKQLTMRLKRAFGRPARGAVLALLGPDGSGKTATLQALMDLVPAALGWPVKCIYMGPWGHDHFRLMTYLRYPVPASLHELIERRRGWLEGGHAPPALHAALALEWRRWRGRERMEDADVRARARECNLAWLVFIWIRGHGRYLCFLSMLLLEMSWRYLQVLKWRRQGALVVCDRYIFDLLVGGMFAVSARYQWARWLICGIFPKPDFAVLLWTDRETLLSRKQQIEPAMLDRIRDIYAGMEREWGLERIMSERSPESVARQIITRGFRRLVAARHT